MLLALPADLLQICLLHVPLPSLGSCPLVCKLFEQLVIGTQGSLPLWKVRLEEERVGRMLACRLAAVVHSMRRASSAAFEEFWRLLKPEVEVRSGDRFRRIEVPRDDALRRVSMDGNFMNDVGCAYDRNMGCTVACPRAHDLPSNKQEALALRFLDKLYCACINFHGASVGYFVLTPCAVRAIAVASEWYLSLLHVACTTAALPVDAICCPSAPYTSEEKELRKAAVKELIFKKDDSEDDHSDGSANCVAKVLFGEQELANAANESLTPAQLSPLLLEHFLDAVAMHYAHSPLALANGRYGGADDDAGKWEDGVPPDFTADRGDSDDSEFDEGGLFQYGVRYVARDTRRVGPVPQVLVTAADLLNVLRIHHLLWSAQQPFARSATAEIAAELQHGRPELVELARRQFGCERQACAPVVQRYLDGLEHGDAFFFARLPERARPFRDDESEDELTDDESADAEDELTDDESAESEEAGSGGGEPYEVDSE